MNGMTMRLLEEATIGSLSSPRDASLLIQIGVWFQGKCPRRGRWVLSLIKVSGLIWAALACKRDVNWRKVMEARASLKPIAEITSTSERLPTEL